MNLFFASSKFLLYVAVETKKKNRRNNDTTMAEIANDI